MVQDCQAIRRNRQRRSDLVIRGILEDHPTAHLLPFPAGLLVVGGFLGSRPAVHRWVAGLEPPGSGTQHVYPGWQPSTALIEAVHHKDAECGVNLPKLEIHGRAA